MELADAGLVALEEWMKEIGVVTEVTSLGVNESNIDAIADATIPMPGGYKQIKRDDVVKVLKSSL